MCRVNTKVIKSKLDLQKINKLTAIKKKKERERERGLLIIR